MRFFVIIAMIILVVLENRLEFLCIDHTNGDGAAHRKITGGAGQRTYLWLRKNGFPEGFRVLCYNCNQALGGFGYCPHQVERGEAEGSVAPQPRMSDRVRQEILVAANHLVSRGIYPSLFKLYKEIGRSAPAMVMQHRQALIEAGKWPTQRIAKTGERNIKPTASEIEAALNRIVPCEHSLAGQNIPIEDPRFDCA